MASQSTKAHEKKSDKYRTSNQTTRKISEMGKSIPIHLAVGSFDPLSEGGVPSLPDELTLQSYREDETGYYILQFTGPVLEKWKEEVVSAGASLFDYIPQFAFIVEMDQQTRNALQTMDSVRWIGIYQPGYRIAPDLLVTISEKRDRPIELVLSVFEGESVSTLTSKIERLGGEILLVSQRKEKFRVKIPINRITSVSRLTGIKYIEKAPQFKLSPNIKYQGGVD
jgi:hypothetical protein